MRKLIEYLSAFEPSLTGAVEGVPDADIQELAALIGAALPDDYVDFLRTMGRDLGPLRLFEGNADFRFAVVKEFYSSLGWRPRSGAIFVGLDNSGGGADYFLEPASGPGSPRELARRPPEEDDFPPILVHPDFPNMLFTLGFLSLRLKRFPHQGMLLADASKVWDAKQPLSRLELLGDIARGRDLGMAPHTGSWSVAYNGSASGLVYYEVPGHSPSLLLGADTSLGLDALTAKLAGPLLMVRVK